MTSSSYYPSGFKRMASGSWSVCSKWWMWSHRRRTDGPGCSVNAPTLLPGSGPGRPDVHPGHCAQPLTTVLLRPATSELPLRCSTVTACKVARFWTLCLSIKSDMLKMILKTSYVANKVLRVVLHQSSYSGAWAWIFYEFSKYDV